jgi:hypothetical protein
MASGALRDYFGRGLASARPAAPDLYDDVLGFWFATDTGILSAWNGSAWEDVASVDPIVAAPPSGGWSNGAMLIYSATLGAFVEIPPGTPGQVMTFQTGDTADWEDPTGGGAVLSVNGQTGAVVLSLFDLSDVMPNTGTPEDGDALTWDAAQGAWVASPAVGGVASVNGQTGVVSLSLEDLDDVMTGTGAPDVGDTLVWDGSQWVAQPGSGGAVSSVNGQTGTVLLGLEDLVDVLPNTGAPDDGDVLRYSAADDAWRAEPLPSGNGSKTIATWGVGMSSQPPASNFATLDTRNSRPLGDLDDTTDENFYLDGVVPDEADLSSGIAIDTWYCMTIATSGNIVPANALERLIAGGQDFDSDGFDTESTVVSAVNGTSGVLSKATITLTAIDSLAPGDPFRLKCGRRPSNGSDNASGDAEYWMVRARWVA